MSITQLATTANTSSTQTTQRSTQDTAAATPAGRALQSSQTRLQAQLETAGTRISTLGALKSAIADVQTAARSLGGLTTTASASQAKAAAAALVAAFNGALSAATTADASSAADGSSTRFGGSLRRTLLAGTATLDALRSLGIQQRSDGSLVLDAKKFDAAQAASPTTALAALIGFGQTVERSATKELGSGARLSSSLNALGQTSAALKSQQSALSAAQKALSSTATTTAATTTSGSYWQYGLAAYRSGY